MSLSPLNEITRRPDVEGKYDEMRTRKESEREAEIRLLDHIGNTEEADEKK